MEKNNGGPAFPSHGSMGEVATDGISLRDYFAAAALPQAIVIDEALPSLIKNNGPENAARIAYLYADAMLEQSWK